MRKNALTIVGLALVLVVGITVLTYAREGGGPPLPPSPPGPHDPDMDAPPPPGPGVGPGRGEMPPPPPGPGNSQGRGRRFFQSPGGPQGRPAGSLFQRLGLTDEQQQKLRDLRTNMKNTSREQRMKLVSLEDEKQTMLSSGKLDVDRMEKIDEELVKISADLLKARLKVRRDGLAILTPEQIKRLGDGAEDALLRGGPGWMFRGHHRRPDRTPEQ